MTTFSSQAATQDAFIFSAEPNTNYGSNVQLQVGYNSSGAGGEVRSVIGFYWTVAEPFYIATVTDATLSLWVYADNQNSSDTWRVYWSSKTFTENDVTWNRADSVDLWDTPGGDYTTELGSVAVTNSHAVGYEIQISLDTDEVKNIVNYNYSPAVGSKAVPFLFLVKADTPGAAGYYGLDSAEGSTAEERPKLVINYTQALMGQVI